MSKKTDQVFHSFEEFARAYYPDHIKQKEVEHETPEESGKKLAQETVREVKRAFRRSRRRR